MSPSAAMPPGTDQALTVLIPARNEAGSIADTLAGLAPVLEPVDRVLLAVDTADDPTVPPARDTARQLSLNLQVVLNPGRGPADAVRAGIAACETAWLALVTADGSDEPASLAAMRRLLAADAADLVCGSRWMPGGQAAGGPVLKRLLSQAGGRGLYALGGLPIRDASNTFMAMQLAALRPLQPKSRRGFTFALEWKARAAAAGLRVRELPTRWQDRQAGQSKFPWRSLPDYLRWAVWSLLRQTGRRSVAGD